MRQKHVSATWNSDKSRDETHHGLVTRKCSVDVAATKSHLFLLLFFSSARTQRIMIVLTNWLPVAKASACSTYWTLGMTFINGERISLLELKLHFSILRLKSSNGSLDPNKICWFVCYIAPQANVLVQSRQRVGWAHLTRFVFTFT